MTRSVSATEAKAKLADLMRWAVKTGDDVIIQSRGYPQVVIVPFKEYEEIQALKERARRAAAVARLSAGPTLRANRWPEAPSGPSVRRKAINLRPARQRSWSITGWTISMPW